MVAEDEQGDRKSTRHLIGVLASHEDYRRHDELVGLLDDLVSDSSCHALLRKFAFAFTGGTFRRIFDGREPPKHCQKGMVDTETKRFLLEECGVIKLPHYQQGGVVFLTYLVVERRISIVWPFLTPITSHWLQPENNALTRLCDYWHVNRFLNARSIREWFPERAVYKLPNPQIWQPEPIFIQSIGRRFPFVKSDKWLELKIPKQGKKAKQVGVKEKKEKRLALIAHDDMKDRMAAFVLDYEFELAKYFSKIITTGTTGARVREVAPKLAGKIHPYYSGPKGGDVQIATEIMLGLIDVVVFFIDPLHPHPHIDDIRVVFGACMMNSVRMLTNERQARDYMDNELG